MAKRAKVALTVLVTEETRGTVKALADELECAQGVVIDRAVETFRAECLANAVNNDPDEDGGADVTEQFKAGYWEGK